MERNKEVAAMNSDAHMTGDALRVTRRHRPKSMERNKEVAAMNSDAHMTGDALRVTRRHRPKSMERNNEEAAVNSDAHMTGDSLRVTRRHRPKSMERNNEEAAVNSDAHMTGEALRVTRSHQSKSMEKNKEDATKNSDTHMTGEALRVTRSHQPKSMERNKEDATKNSDTHMTGEALRVTRSHQSKSMERNTEDAAINSDANMTGEALRFTRSHQPKSMERNTEEATKNSDAHMTAEALRVTRSHRPKSMERNTEEAAINSDAHMTGDALRVTRRHRPKSMERNNEEAAINSDAHMTGDALRVTRRHRPKSMERNNEEAAMNSDAYMTGDALRVTRRHRPKSMERNKEEATKNSDAHMTGEALRVTRNHQPKSMERNTEDDTKNSDAHMTGEALRVTRSHQSKSMERNTEDATKNSDAHMTGEALRVTRSHQPKSMERNTEDATKNSDAHMTGEALRVTRSHQSKSMERNNKDASPGTENSVTQTTGEASRVTRSRTDSSNEYNRKEYGRQFTWNCEVCRFSNKARAVVANHIRHVHGGSSNVISQLFTFKLGKQEQKLTLKKDAKSRRFKCPYCVKMSDQKINMLTHIRLHTGELPFKCKVCRSKKGSQYAIAYHIWKMHEAAAVNLCISITGSGVDIEDEVDSRTNLERAENVNKRDPSETDTADEEIEISTEGENEKGSKQNGSIQHKDGVVMNKGSNKTVASQRQWQESYDGRISDVANLSAKEPLLDDGDRVPGQPVEEKINNRDPNKIKDYAGDLTTTDNEEMNDDGGDKQNANIELTDGGVMTRGRSGCVASGRKEEYVRAGTLKNTATNNDKLVSAGKHVSDGEMEDTVITRSKAKDGYPVLHKEMYCCLVCDFKSAKSTDVVEHIWRKHKLTTSSVSKLFTFQCGKKEQQMILKRSCKSQLLRCPYCPKKSKDMNRMKNHVRIHTGERPFQCAVCGCKKKRDTGIARHIWNVHEAVAINSCMKKDQDEMSPVKSTEQDMDESCIWDRNTANGDLKSIKEPVTDGNDQVQRRPMELNINDEPNKRQDGAGEEMMMGRKEVDEGGVRLYASTELRDSGEASRLRTSRRKRTKPSKTTACRNDKLVSGHKTISDDEGECRASTRLEGKDGSSQISYKEIHSCLECAFKSASSTDVKKHVLSKHKGTTSSVSKLFTFQRGKKEQKMILKRDANNGLLKCPYCSKKGKKMYHMKCHIRLHTGECPYQCKVCCCKLKWQSNIISHIWNMHEAAAINACMNKELNESAVSATTGTSTKTRHSYRKCEFQSPSSAKLKDQVIDLQRGTSTTTGHSCRKCEFQSPSSAKLKEHVRDLHSGSNTAITKYFTFKPGPIEKKLQLKKQARTGLFQCPYCSKTSKNSFNLFAHIRVHARELPFNCRLCSRRASQKTHMVRHIQKMHSEVGISKCLGEETDLNYGTGPQESTTPTDEMFTSDEIEASDDSDVVLGRRNRSQEKDESCLSTLTCQGFEALRLPTTNASVSVSHLVDHLEVESGRQDTRSNSALSGADPIGGIFSNMEEYFQHLHPSVTEENGGTMFCGSGSNERCYSKDDSETNVHNAKTPECDQDKLNHQVVSMKHSMQTSHSVKLPGPLDEPSKTGKLRMDIMYAPSASERIMLATLLQASEFRCPYCGKQFCTGEDVTLHSRHHTLEKPYQCMHCGYRTAHKSPMEDHVRLQHKRNSPTSIADLFTSKSANVKLNVDFDQDSVTKKYICCHCLKESVTLLQAKLHGRNHTKVYRCKLCGFEGPQKLAMIEHIEKSHPDLIPSCRQKIPSIGSEEDSSIRDVERSNMLREPENGTVNRREEGRCSLAKEAGIEVSSLKAGSFPEEQGREDLVRKTGGEGLKNKDNPARGGALVRKAEGEALTGMSGKQNNSGKKKVWDEYDFTDTENDDEEEDSETVSGVSERPKLGVVVRKADRDAVSSRWNNSGKKVVRDEYIFTDTESDDEDYDDETALGVSDSRMSSARNKNVKVVEKRWKKRKSRNMQSDSQRKEEMDDHTHRISPAKARSVRREGLGWCFNCGGLSIAGVCSGDCNKMRKKRTLIDDTTGNGGDTYMKKQRTGDRTSAGDIGDVTNGRAPTMSESRQSVEAGHSTEVNKIVGDVMEQPMGTQNSDADRGQNGRTERKGVCAEGMYLTRCETLSAKESSTQNKMVETFGEDTEKDEAAFIKDMEGSPVHDTDERKNVASDRVAKSAEKEVFVHGFDVADLKPLIIPLTDVRVLKRYCHDPVCDMKVIDTEDGDHMTSDTELDVEDQDDTNIEMSGANVGKSLDMSVHNVVNGAEVSSDEIINEKSEQENREHVNLKSNGTDEAGSEVQEGTVGGRKEIDHYQVEQTTAARYDDDQLQVEQTTAERNDDDQQQVEQTTAERNDDNQLQVEQTTAERNADDQQQVEQTTAERNDDNQLQVEQTTAERKDDDQQQVEQTTAERNDDNQLQFEQTTAERKDDDQLQVVQTIVEKNYDDQQEVKQTTEVKDDDDDEGEEINDGEVDIRSDMKDTTDVLHVLDSNITMGALVDKVVTEALAHNKLPCFMRGTGDINDNDEYARNEMQELVDSEKNSVAGMNATDIDLDIKMEPSSPDGSIDILQAGLIEGLIESLHQDYEVDMAGTEATLRDCDAWSSDDTKAGNQLTPEHGDTSSHTLDGPSHSVLKQFHSLGEEQNGTAGLSNASNWISTSNSILKQSQEGPAVKQVVEERRTDGEVDGTNKGTADMLRVLDGNRSIGVIPQIMVKEELAHGSDDVNAGNGMQVLVDSKSSEAGLNVTDKDQDVKIEQRSPVRCDGSIGINQAGLIESDNHRHVEDMASADSEATDTDCEGWSNDCSNVDEKIKDKCTPEKNVTNDPVLRPSHYLFQEQAAISAELPSVSNQVSTSNSNLNQRQVEPAQDVQGQLSVPINSTDMPSNADESIIRRMQNSAAMNEVTRQRAPLLDETSLTASLHHRRSEERDPMNQTVDASRLLGFPLSQGTNLIPVPSTTGDRVCNMNPNQSTWMNPQPPASKKRSVDFVYAPSAGEKLIWDRQIVQCPVCSIVKDSTKDIMRHMRERHSGETPFRCCQCVFSSMHIQTMVDHVNRLHPSSLFDLCHFFHICQWQANNGATPCNPSASGKNACRPIHSDAEFYHCSVCGFKSFQLPLMVDHAQRTHKKSSYLEVDPSSQQVVCPVCLHHWDNVQIAMSHTCSPASRNMAFPYGENVMESQGQRAERRNIDAFDGGRCNSIWNPAGNMPTIAYQASHSNFVSPGQEVFQSKNRSTIPYNPSHSNCAPSSQQAFQGTQSFRQHPSSVNLPSTSPKIHANSSLSDNQEGVSPGYTSIGYSSVPGSNPHPNRSANPGWYPSRPLAPQPWHQMGGKENPLQTPGPVPDIPSLRTSQGSSRAVVTHHGPFMHQREAENSTHNALVHNAITQEQYIMQRRATEQNEELASLHSVPRYIQEQASILRQVLEQSGSLDPAHVESNSRKELHTCELNTGKNSNIGGAEIGSHFESTANSEVLPVIVNVRSLSTSDSRRKELGGGSREK